MDTELTRKLILERRAELRKYKKLANKYLAENIENKDSHKRKWEHQVYEKNIVKLKEIITDINRESKDAAIEEYVKNEISIVYGKETIFQVPGVRNAFNNVKSGIEEYKIVRYSPTYSVIHDLFWITDGTLGDQMDIALGKKKPEIYGRYLRDKILIIKEKVYPVLESRNELIQSLKILKSSFYNLDQNNYAAANILIITLIEGLVRIICKEIYSRQNPDISNEALDDYIYHNFSSVETLITKGDFNPDFEISLVDGYLLNQHVISDELDEIEREFLEYKSKTEWFKGNMAREMQELLELVDKLESESDREVINQKLLNIQNKLGAGPMKIDEKRKISIKPRLQFLLRSFKEDRNLIIHGKYDEFDKPWKSYLYCVALLKVNEILNEYL